MTISNSWTDSTRQRRMSGEQVERKLLETARAIVAEHGLSISFDHLHFDDLIRAANVSRSSAYRRWPTKEDFFAEFLASLALPAGAVGSAHDERTKEVGREVFERHRHLLEHEPGRRAVLAEAVRVGVQRNFEAMTSDNRWKIYAALVSTVNSSPDAHIRETVLDALRTADHQFIDAMSTFYEGLLPAAGAQFKPGIKATHLAAAGAAVVEGLVTRLTVNPTVAMATVPGPKLGGGTIEWPIAAFAFLGITHEMTYFLTDAEYSGS